MCKTPIKEFLSKEYCVKMHAGGWRGEVTVAVALSRGEEWWAHGGDFRVRGCLPGSGF